MITHKLRYKMSNESSFKNTFIKTASFAMTCEHWPFLVVAEKVKVDIHN